MYLDIRIYICNMYYYIVQLLLLSLLYHNCIYISDYRTIIIYNRAFETEDHHQPYPFFFVDVSFFWDISRISVDWGAKNLAPEMRVRVHNSDGTIQENTQRNPAPVDLKTYLSCSVTGFQLYEVLQDFFQHYC